nr:ORF3 protein [Armillaria gallica negative stranded RNA virus 1]
MSNPTSYKQKWVRSEDLIATTKESWERADKTASELSRYLAEARKTAKALVVATRDSVKEMKEDEWLSADIRGHLAGSTITDYASVSTAALLNRVIAIADTAMLAYVETARQRDLLADLLNQYDISIAANMDKLGKHLPKDGDIDNASQAGPSGP